jgi:hypothetical protein
MQSCLGMPLSALTQNPLTINLARGLRVDKWLVPESKSLLDVAVWWMYLNM